MSAGSTTQKYGTILTATGKAAIANAVATNTLIALKYIALGDGGGSEYYPGESQTALKNQVYQMPANGVYVDPDNPNWIVVEGMLPESAGGFTIREAAIKDEDGKVIAIGSYPPSYKPKLEEGSAVGIGFKFIMEVTNADVVNMNIDPSTVYATIQYVNNRVSNHASETNAHGGTYIATPLRLMFRNEAGRCQVEAPVENKDAANKGWTEQASSEAIQTALAKFIGTVFWFAGMTAPEGALVCNGAAISRVGYAELFSVIGTTYGAGDGSTTFNIPDLRGEFIRGWDNGRGVDAERAFGSTQTGSIGAFDASAQLQPAAHIVGYENGEANARNGLGYDRINKSDYPGITQIGFGPGTTMGLGDGLYMGVTRPRNVALLPCIQYK